MKHRRNHEAPAHSDGFRPPYGAAAVAALCVAGLYVITLAPTTQFWDASEYIATAHILGIPHPPGNPLFIVLARAWDVLLAPTGLPVAVRINLFSAAMSALAHGLWFLVIQEMLSRGRVDRRFAMVGAAAAVLVSATAFTVWNQSNVNEKVYTVSLFTIALLTWLALRWRARLGRVGEDNVLILMAFVLALSVGNHLMAFLAAPALVLFVMIVRPRSLLSARLWAGLVCAAVIGLSIHVFLPLRAGLDPVINQADPSSWEALFQSLARKQYQKPSIFTNPVLPDLARDPSLIAAQIANFFQYFDWQWARSLAGYDSWFGGLRPFVTLLFIAFGIAGAVTHFRRDRASAVYFAVLFATLSLGLVAYMNFKYGFTYPIDAATGALPESTEVRERDYFFLVGFSVWGVWAGLGIAAAWRAAAARIQLPRARILALPVLAFAFVPLAANWGWATRSADHAARDWAYNVLMSVEPYGVLFTNGDNDTFPLWYLQEVEGIRRDVTVIVQSYLGAPWYVKQMRDLTTPCADGIDPSRHPTRILCQRPYEGGHAVYASLDRPPEDSVIQLTDEEIEQISQRAFVTEAPVRLRVGALETTVPQGTVVMPSDTFVTAVLAAALGDRPIHFMMPNPVLSTLNLSEHAVRTGLTVRLNNGPVGVEVGRIARVPENDFWGLTGRWVDVERTDTLARDVFIYRNLPDDPPVWADSATRNIPPNYAWMHVALGAVAASNGDQNEASRQYARAQRWIDVVQPEL